MKWKPMFAMLLGFLILEVTAGSASAIVWSVPAGSRTGATDEGIDPHIKISGGYDGIEASLEVSWNDHHGAAWGVWQWGNYDDSIHQYIGFHSDGTYRVKGYSTPLIGYTKISYSVDLNINMPFKRISMDGDYYVVTTYHVVVKKTTTKWLSDPDTKTIVDKHDSIGYLAQNPSYGY
ncbi:hypothetical protein [Thermococcus sp. Bubb.Bath]|uniref:hypothetical protein n=2 Tax=unclassified Thermococcus TaxID=2627626 RepID=UPI001438A9AA|nr:hypothetical protein [Thermococcus sp. Bubb.Bath]NJF24943.1 hypothetical protein [Thermococcus sp. Bubb.Bath]